MKPKALSQAGSLRGWPQESLLKVPSVDRPFLVTFCREYPILAGSECASEFIDGDELRYFVVNQEAEKQIITHYAVYEERPSDRHLLLPAVEAQQRKLVRVPELVAGDAGFYSHLQEEGVKQLGVKYVSVPNRSTRSEERRKLEKQR